MYIISRRVPQVNRSIILCQAYQGQSISEAFGKQRRLLDFLAALPSWMISGGVFAFIPAGAESGTKITSRSYELVESMSAYVPDTPL